MATVMGQAASEALVERASALAERVRYLIESHAIETDAARPGDLARTLDDACEELRDELLASGRRTVPAASLCELLVELTELQQDLREQVISQRFSSLSRIHGGLARLRDLPTVTDLLRETPEELCHCCDFDRGLVSRVRGSTWVPEVICIAVGQDEETTADLTEYLSDVEIPLSPMLLETELARRGSPALVTDPMNDPRTFKDLMAISRTSAYVAAPVMSSNRVIGFLHADTFGTGRELTTLDRDNVWTFAEGFGLIFERMVLVERLGEQRTRVREAFQAADGFLDSLCDAEVKLARHEREALPVASAVGMFSSQQSRVHMLLTGREREVLALMVSGARNISIANQLVISEGTVKSHVKNICRKLHASNRAEAVSKYLQLVIKERA